MGVISAVGSTAGENRTALAKGVCGIGQLQNFPSRYAGVLPFGVVKTSTDELKLKHKINDPSVTRTTLLAINAFKEAIQDAALTTEQVTSPNTALIGATTVGGMCLADELYRDANESYNNSPYHSSYDCASVFLFMQQAFKMQGIINTINTACSSSANAIMYGARLIQNGWAAKAIVGGTDSLSKFTINGFNSLHILSPEICRPFDETRQGLNLGEGAAFLVLEAEENIAGKKVYAEVKGWHNTTDAFHPSSLSGDGEGPYLSMQGALQHAGLTVDDIGYINAHGTATENNDLSESRAMIRLFNNVPQFTSTKSNIGHTLGASGAIEAVYSILSLVNGEIYPSLQFNSAIGNTGLQPVTEYQTTTLKNVMSNSFGFGGNCSSLIFSSPS